MAASKLLKRIRLEARRSLEARERYTEQQLKQVTDSLETAQREVVALVKGMGRAGSLRPGDELKLGGLRELRKEIDAVTSQLAKVVRLRVVTGLKGSFDGGIKSTITELVKAAAPDWGKMGKDGLERTYSAAFAVVDRQALDFMTGYTLQLAGSVPVELGNKIKTGVLQGIATGLGPDEIVKRLGKVVRDKEDFRNAGGRVFPSAQARLDAIVRTELTRAHSQGRNKMFGEVGLQVVTWETVGDERVCPTCDALQGKRFKLDPAMKGDLEVLPDMPLHTLCRCMTFADEPEKAEPPARLWERAREMRAEVQPAARDRYAAVPNFRGGEAAAEWLVERKIVKGAANFTGLTGEQGRAVAQVLAQTVEDFPNVKARLGSVGTIDGIEELAAAADEAQFRVREFAEFAKDGGEAAAMARLREVVATGRKASREYVKELRERKTGFAFVAADQRPGMRAMKDLLILSSEMVEQLPALAETNTATGWWNKGMLRDPLRWVTHHEVGHFLSDQIAPLARERLRVAFHKTGAKVVADELSKYATVHWEETVAEGWAQWRMMGEKASPLAQKIGRFMEKELGKL